VPRAGLSPDAVVDAALAVTDASGPAALTLAKVAERTGVATPSLYKHVDGLPALLRLIKLRVLGDLTDEVRRAVAGLAKDDAVRALANGYRDYLRRYPGRYPFVETAPDPTDPELHTVSSELVEVLFAVLRGYGLDDERVVHATRCLRAAVGGFARLEAIGGFGMPQDIDTTFRYLVDMYIAGLVT